MHVFGLLHLAECEKTAVNVSTNGFDDQVSVYLNNARTLSNSLDLVGFPFTLLTNSGVFLRDLASKGTGLSLDIIDIPFSTEVPTGTHFYSAHFKLDAYRYLASLNEG